MVKDHYVERAPFTQNLAEAMIEGFIDFDMCKDAAKLFTVCLSEGWTVNRDLMWRLFHSCLTLSDTAASKMIVRGLLDHIDQASLLLLGPEGISPALVRQMRHLLNVWQAASLSRDESRRSGDGGDDIFQTTTRQLERSKLTHLTTAIWIQEQMHHARVMRWWLRRVRHQLSDTRMPLAQRLDRANHVLDLAISFPQRKMAKSDLVRRVSKMDWLATQAVVSRLRIQNAAAVIARVAVRETPRALRAPGVHSFDPTVPAAVRLGRALPFVTPGTAERAAALCFERSRRIDQELRVALLDAMPQTLARALWETRSASGDVPLGRIHAYFSQYLAGLRSRIAWDASRARRDMIGRLLSRFSPARLKLWASSEEEALGTAASVGREEDPGVAGPSAQGG
jgi:hypothetical protein